MKFLRIFFLIPIFCFMFPVSCSKKTKDLPTFDKSDFAEIPDYEKLFEESFLPSVVLAPDAGLNILGRDKKMHRMKILSRGNVFETIALNGNVESINLYTDGNENPETYCHAVSDNVDFWIFSDYVALDAVPAIMTENSDGLKFGQIVALGKKNQTEEIIQKVPVWYFDSSKDKVLCIMIDPEKVSTYSDDIEMAAIIEKLRVTTRAVPRNELFLRAEKLNPSPAMQKILDEQKTEKLSYDYQEVLKSMPGARYIVNVEELNTVDQSKDPFKN